MFGLGKLISGLTGGLLDKIGLGFLKPIVSMAVSFYSMDYQSLIGDVLNLVSRFSDSSFLKNLSAFQPLGLFGQGGGSGCFGMDMPSFTEIGGWRDAAQLLGLDRAEKMFDLVEDFSITFNVIQQNRESAYYGRLYN